MELSVLKVSDVPRACNISSPGTTLQELPLHYPITSTVSGGGGISVISPFISRPGARCNQTLSGISFNLSFPSDQTIIRKMDEGAKNMNGFGCEL